MADESTTTTESTDRDALLKASYQSALKRLREEHIDRFNALRVEEAQKRGIEWTPPKTERDKAAEKMAALLAEFPDLAETVTAPAAASTPGEAQTVPDTRIPDPVSPDSEPSRI